MGLVAPYMGLYYECVYTSGPYADVLACTHIQVARERERERELP